MSTHHARCVYCGGTQCTCFDTDEEYGEAIREARRHMTIIEAISLCKSGHKVRPVSWRTINPGCWVEFRANVFVEVGTMQEIPHALRLQFLGEWEYVD